MRTGRLLRALLATGLLPAGLAAGPGVGPAAGSHAWGSYHWSRASNPLALELGSNLSAAWSPYLDGASGDWSRSTVLDTVVRPGGTSPKRCSPTAGRVEVCNAAYGKQGWLGVAQIWASGSHISQATVKLNDTYFNTATYNTRAWRNLVTCQEVGHTLGLAHQDEAYDNPNLGTCMDYTRDPESNQHPNDHDFAQLELLYGHFDAATPAAQDAPPRNRNAASPGAHDGQAEWGTALRSSPDGRTSLYARELAGGRRLFTFVIWAD